MTQEQETPSVIFEMMRSFVVLAQTLNVSQTAETLKLTRQTIKRHINNLEAIKGKKLFKIENRQYLLTEFGHTELYGAEKLLNQLDHWLNKEYELISGLTKIHYETNTDEFWAQRYPAIEVWNLAPPLIKRGLQCWGESNCQLEHPKLKKVRPYLIVYRRHNGDWICVDVGEKSSYSSWLGWAWAKSAIGVSIRNDPISSKSDEFIVNAYDTVARTGGVWYDHIHTKFIRKSNGEVEYVNYQRLLMALFFPNGEQAVASLVARTNQINIHGLPPGKLPLMSEVDLMDFEI